MNILRRNILIGLLAALGLLAFVLVSIVSAGGRPLTAALSSANEVPPSGTGATGTASLTFNQGQGEVCVDLETDGLAGNVFAGHIHAGPAGQNGGVVVNLEITSGDFSGCVTGVDQDTIKAIRQNPEIYYVNIHTAAVPSGEIRGQLEK